MEAEYIEIKIGKWLTKRYYNPLGFAVLPDKHRVCELHIPYAGKRPRHKLLYCAGGDTAADQAGNCHAPNDAICYLDGILTELAAGGMKTV